MGLINRLQMNERIPNIIYAAQFIFCILNRTVFQTQQIR